MGSITLVLYNKTETFVVDDAKGTNLFQAYARAMGGEALVGAPQVRYGFRRMLLEAQDIAKRQLNLERPPADTSGVENVIPD